MSRKEEFVTANPTPTVVQDSRFGIRAMPQNSEEVPSIFSYANPGRGQNGEHQN